MGVKARTAKHKQYKRGSPTEWNADSGANVSVTNDISILHTITDFQPHKAVRVANKQLVAVTCIGTAKLNLTDDKGLPYVLMLENVCYSPHFAGNLLSIEELFRQHKCATLFKGNKAELQMPNGVIIPFRTDSKRRYMLQANSVLSLIHI